MCMNSCKRLGIDIGSTTVKVSIINEKGDLVFADYKRHFANIQETLSDLLDEASSRLGETEVTPVITGSGGLTLSKHLGIPFVRPRQTSLLNSAARMRRSFILQAALIRG